MVRSSGYCFERIKHGCSLIENCNGQNIIVIFLCGVHMSKSIQFFWWLILLPLIDTCHTYVEAIFAIFSICGMNCSFVIGEKKRENTSYCMLVLSLQNNNRFNIVDAICNDSKFWLIFMNVGLIYVVVCFIILIILEEKYTFNEGKSSLCTFSTSFIVLVSTSSGWVRNIFRSQVKNASLGKWLLNRNLYSNDIGRLKLL